MTPSEMIGESFKASSNRSTVYTRVADLFASYIDRPNDPKARGSLRDKEFFQKFFEILPPEKYGYTPEDFGVLQQNPQYRGLRMVLPKSGGSYGEVTFSEGARLAGEGAPRVTTQGPVGEPDPRDPHSNSIPRHPANYPPDLNGLREAVYGELVRRGYPVYGGTGDIGGDFQKGFNPVGFGQRDRP